MKHLVKRLGLILFLCFGVMFISLGFNAGSIFFILMGIGGMVVALIIAWKDFSTTIKNVLEMFRKK